MSDDFESSPGCRPVVALEQQPARLPRGALGEGELRATKRSNQDHDHEHGEHVQQEVERLLLAAERVDQIR